MIQFNHVPLLAVFPPSTCENPNTCETMYVHTVKITGNKHQAIKNKKKSHPTPLIFKTPAAIGGKFHIPNSTTTPHNACPGRREAHFPYGTSKEESSYLMAHSKQQRPSSLGIEHPPSQTLLPHPTHIPSSSAQPSMGLSQSSQLVTAGACKNLNPPEPLCGCSAANALRGFWPVWVWVLGGGGANCWMDWTDWACNGAG
jgi:hypothetical protein